MSENDDNFHKKDASCDLCGHKWTRRTKNPVQCPGCGARNWARKRINKLPEPANIIGQPMAENLQPKTDDKKDNNRSGFKLHKPIDL